jgi:hypothetical protein
MNWLRDWIYHCLGWETYEEALARIAYEIERDYPLDQMRAENRMRNEIARIEREMRSQRLDRGGEYERGIKGLQ